MLHIQGISAAQGWDYLTRQVLHAGDDYYAGSEDAQGERPGRWAGQSEVLLGLSGEVSEDLFRSVFGDRQHPQTGQTLGRARRTYQSIEERVAKARAAAAVEGPLGPEELAAIERRVRRTDRMSVDAFDATFSPVKSVSVLWAAMDPDGRREVEGAQQVAVDTALEVLRREAAYSRTGHHSSRLDANYSGRFEDTDGLVVAAFDHRMSRAGDPQLHTHAVVLNLARTSRDGAWRALDSRALHRAKDLAGAVYELTLMHELTNRLGVAWSVRPDGKAYEIEGITASTLAHFSSRRVAITAGLAPLVEEYQRTHGRDPSPYELNRMSEWVTLSTRPRKAGSESTTDALARWQADHLARTNETLTEVASRATGQASSRASELAAEERGVVVAEALTRIQTKRVTFDRADLAREVSFVLGGYVGGGADAAAVAARLESLTDEALERPAVLALRGPDPIDLPSELRRRDGSSVYVAPHSTPFATEGRMGFEERVKAAAVQRTDLFVPAGQVMGLDPEGDLSLEQRDAAIRVLDSGLRLQALVGPAGAGKTTVLRHVAQVWHERTNGRIIGLAPSQIAAEVLRAELNLPETRSDRVKVANTSRWMSRAARDPEEWGLRFGDLVILDEAGMSSDVQLQHVLTAVQMAGARLLCVGDPAQLASPDAGAGYALLTEQPGTVTLAEVRRFHAAWERQASLALRAGDPVALDEYDRRGRIHHGSRLDMEHAAWQAWAADTALGRSSLLVVTNAVELTALNERARAHHVGLGHVDDSVTIALRDGSRVGEGDVIVTRRNDPKEAGGHAINRRSWTVTAVDPRGVSVVPPDRPDEVPVRLSAHYVGEHVELGYARLPHGTQGMTVDTTHLILGHEGTDRAGVYVPMSRGRGENHAYVETLVVNHEGETLRCDQALAVLSRSLARDTTQVSATETLRAELDSPRSVPAVAVVLDDVTSRLSHEQNLHRIQRHLPDGLAARLTSDPATPALLRRLHELDVAGVPTEQLLRASIGERGFGDAQSIALVLRWRLDSIAPDPRHIGGGLHFLEGVDLRSPLVAVAQEARRLLDARTVALGEFARIEVPEWTLTALGRLPSPREEPDWMRRAGAIAAWREYAAIDPSDLTLGSAPHGPQAIGRQLWRQARDALQPMVRPLDVRELSAEELAGLVARGERALAAQPPFVDGPLWAAHIETRRLRNQVGLAERVGGSVGSGERDVEVTNDSAALLEGRRRLERGERWVNALERKVQVRADWRAGAVEELTLGVAAARELVRRDQRVGGLRELGHPLPSRPPRSVRQEALPAWTMPVAGVLIVGRRLS